MLAQEQQLGQRYSCVCRVRTDTIWLEPWDAAALGRLLTPNQRAVIAGPEFTRPGHKGDKFWVASRSAAWRAFVLLPHFFYMNISNDEMWAKLACDDRQPSDDWIARPAMDWRVRGCEQIAVRPRICPEVVVPFAFVKSGLLLQDSCPITGAFVTLSSYHPAEVRCKAGSPAATTRVHHSEEEDQPVVFLRRWRSRTGADGMGQLTQDSLDMPILLQFGRLQTQVHYAAFVRLQVQLLPEDLVLTKLFQFDEKSARAGFLVEALVPELEFMHETALEFTVQITLVDVSGSKRGLPNAKLSWVLGRGVPTEQDFALLEDWGLKILAKVTRRGTSRLRAASDRVLQCITAHTAQTHTGRDMASLVETCQAREHEGMRTPSLEIQNLDGWENSLRVLLEEAMASKSLTRTSVAPFFRHVQAKSDQGIRTESEQKEEDGDDGGLLHDRAPELSTVWAY